MGSDSRVAPDTLTSGGCVSPGLVGMPTTSRSRISGIANGKRSITADTALRFGKYFGTSAETWLDLRSDYDLPMLRRTGGDEIEAQVRVRAA
jgi:antitoxin HigA-1